MPFSRPTLSQLIALGEFTFNARIPGADSRLRRSLISVLLRVVAGAVHGLYGFLDWVSEQVFPDTAEAEHLDRWASIWGVARLGAEFASGSVTVTGTAGSSVPVGAVLQRSDGVQFEVTTGVTLSGGSDSVQVTALEAGAEANTDAGQTVSFVSPISGVSAEATVAAGGIAGGADRESDEGLRERLLARIQEPPHGGAAHDYVRWAREVPGVTRAWCLPLHSGPGTVGVTFVRDDDSSIIPDGGEVQDVQDHIDALRPVTANVTVFAPTPVDVDFTISVTPDTPEVRAAVEAELADLIRREAEPGGTILRSHIREAISSAAGEEDHAVTVPAGDVSVAADELPVMGTVTWV